MNGTALGIRFPSFSSLLLDFSIICFSILMKESGRFALEDCETNVRLSLVRLSQALNVIRKRDAIRDKRCMMLK